MKLFWTLVAVYCGLAVADVAMTPGGPDAWKILIDQLQTLCVSWALFVFIPYGWQYAKAASLLLLAWTFWVCFDHLFPGYPKWGAGLECLLLIGIVFRAYYLEALRRRA